MHQYKTHVDSKAFQIQINNLCLIIKTSKLDFLSIYFENGRWRSFALTFKILQYLESTMHVHQ